MLILLRVIFGVAFLYFAQMAWANPLGSTDVTDMRITTGAVGDARFRVWPLQDPTP